MECRVHALLNEYECIIMNFLDHLMTDIINNLCFDIYKVFILNNNISVELQPIAGLGCQRLAGLTSTCPQTKEKNYPANLVVKCD